MLKYNIDFIYDDEIIATRDSIGIPKKDDRIIVDDCNSLQWNKDEYNWRCFLEIWS